MTDIIYERGQAREATIWSPFVFNGPFDTAQSQERTILFGLYANTYLWGHAYLKEIEAQDLAKLVDTYNASIAQITSEQAKLALEIVAKYYLETIEDQIHQAKMVTRQKSINALGSEIDAKIAALSADQAALITKQQAILFARDKAEVRVKELETQADLEGLAQQLVDKEIIEKQLTAARITLQILKAGSEALNIQLAITQAALDKTNTELGITNANYEKSEMDIRISETNQGITETGIQKSNVEIQESRALAEQNRLVARSGEIAVQVADTALDVEEAGVREKEIAAQTANIEADTAKLDLIDKDLTIGQSDKKVQQKQNQLLLDERDMIKAKGDNVTAETGYYETHKTTQETLDEKIVEHEETKGAAEKDMLEAKTGFKEQIGKLEKIALDEKKDLADDKKDRALDDATDRAEIPKIRAGKAEDYADAAIEAARKLSKADIINTLTHSIGSA